LDEERIKNCRIFHFGTLSMTHEGCRKATEKAISIAEKSGAILSFDPNLREPLWKSLEEARRQILFGMEHCHILKISDNEIQWLTGEKDGQWRGCLPSDPDQLDKILKSTFNK
ncbi:MAG: hypothetical protein K2P41_04220, partial [Lachnospiraceae bacterium]|nr:hypothetical protein [Lachnospiraceae bacterium]